jgi:cation transport ATPase
MDNDGIIGPFYVKDAIREESRAVVLKGLKDAQINVIICIGDNNSATYAAIAKEIGIPRGAFHSQLLPPEDKLHFVGSLKRPQLLELEIKHKHGCFNINYEKATVVWQQFGFGS